MASDVCLSSHRRRKRIIRINVFIISEVDGGEKISVQPHRNAVSCVFISPFSQSLKGDAMLLVELYQHGLRHCESKLKDLFCRNTMYASFYLS